MRSSSSFFSASGKGGSHTSQQQFVIRILALAGLVLFCFALLGWRWTVLQVLRRDVYVAQAENNRTAIVPVSPSRGSIVDRNGVVLASNYSAYTLELTPDKTEDVQATIDALAKIIPISASDRKRFHRLRQDSRGYEPIPLRNYLTDEEIARFAARRYAFPGVEINARLFRSYPYGETSSHLVGYIARINQKEKEALEESEDALNYKGTSHIGKLGVEQSYEAQLHGTSGREQMEVTSTGQIVRQLASMPATPGQNVVLSVDIKLQKLVEDMYGKRRGALVAIDPRDGQVLALVSMPTFNPNLFIDGIDQENWAALNESIDKPLLNRALRGTYPPGSTYKPFMALAALETGKRSANTVIHDSGVYLFGNHRFRGHATGAVNMRSSIVRSSNAYYYSLAHEMGVDTIHDFMQPLGFGQITGIDLRGELRGVLPSQEWKRKTFKRPEQQRWLAGETISLGIGQGYNTFTMLQLSHALATVVNGGKQIPPRVVSALQDPTTRALTPVPHGEVQDLGYKPEHIALIKDAMVGVTKEGTSRGVFAGAAYQSGGKTGTAQAVGVGQNQKYNAAALAERKRDHSLYIAFAPADNPTIAVAAIVENAGFGATAAAPIVRGVLDYWLQGRTANGASATQTSAEQPAAASAGAASGAAAAPNAATSSAASASAASATAAKATTPALLAASGAPAAIYQPSPQAQRLGALFMRSGKAAPSAPAKSATPPTSPATIPPTISPTTPAAPLPKPAAQAKAVTPPAPALPLPAQPVRSSASKPVAPPPDLAQKTPQAATQKPAQTRAGAASGISNAPQVQPQATSKAAPQPAPQSAPKAVPQAAPKAAASGA